MFIIESFTYILLLAVCIVPSTVFAQDSSVSSPPQDANNEHLALGILSILVGFIFLFFGFKWKGLTFFWSSASLFGLTAYVFLWNFWPTCMDFLFVLIPLIFGLSGGIVGYFAKPMGKASLGAMAGISFSMWIFSIRPAALIQNELLLNLVFSGITLAFTCMTYYREFPDDKYPIILASSFSGAYGVFFGFDIFFKIGLGQVFIAVIKGNYESLSDSRYVSVDLIASVDWKLGLMLASTWILFIIGSISQMVNYRGIDIQSMPLGELSTHEKRNIVKI